MDKIGEKSTEYKDSRFKHTYHLIVRKKKPWKLGQYQRHNLPQKELVSCSGVFSQTSEPDDRKRGGSSPQICVPAMNDQLPTWFFTQHRLLLGRQQYSFRETPFLVPLYSCRFALYPQYIYTLSVIKQDGFFAPFQQNK